MTSEVSDDDIHHLFDAIDKQQEQHGGNKMYYDEGIDEEQALVEQGSGQGTYLPPTLSQEHLKFLDGNDEVPNELLKPLWGLFTRHNSLTNIRDPWEMNRIRTQVRAVTRVMMWEGKITLSQMVMIQRYVELQILKSHFQGERRLLAPWLQQITRVEETPDRQMQRPGGTFSKGMGFLFGRR